MKGLIQNYSDMSRTWVGVALTWRQLMWNDKRRAVQDGWSPNTGGGTGVYL